MWMALLGAGGISVSPEAFAMSLAAFLVVAMVARIDKRLERLTSTLSRQGNALVALVVALADDNPALQPHMARLLNGSRENQEGGK